MAVLFQCNDYVESDDEILAAIDREEARRQAREKAANAQANDDKRATTIAAQRVA